MSIRRMVVLAVTTGLGAGVAATTFGFGLRHGLDWDHLAALTDLTGSQSSPRDSMRLATLYALGHSLVVFGLGLLAILFADELPSSVDAAMTRVVGATLVVLAVYVFYGLLRHGREFRLRSRWMMLLDAFARAGRRLHARRADMIVIEHEHEHDHDHGGNHIHLHSYEHVDEQPGESVRVDVAHRHRHRHLAPRPHDPFATYSARTALGVGMLHGIGAETPTQLVLFVTAAGVAGRAAGAVLLGCFVAGLLTSNTLVAAAGTAGILHARRNATLYVAVSVLIGVASLAIGVLFLTGGEQNLPALFGG